MVHFVRLAAEARITCREIRERHPTMSFFHRDATRSAEKASLMSCTMVVGHHINRRDIKSAEIYTRRTGFPVSPLDELARQVAAALGDYLVIPTSA